MNWDAEDNPVCDICGRELPKGDGYMRAQIVMDEGMSVVGREPEIVETSSSMVVCERCEPAFSAWIEACPAAAQESSEID